jgi:hypothetical protein
MKPAIKKLKTCTYSKDLAPSAALFGQREQHTNKLVCDHPEMKVNWSEKVCGPCTVYENRNAELVVPARQPPQPAPAPPVKAAIPTPVKQVSNVAAPLRVPPPPAISAPAKPPSKPADEAKRAAVPPPAKSATKAPEKKAKAAAQTKAKSSAKPTAKVTKKEPQQSAKKTVTKPKKK